MAGRERGPEPAGAGRTAQGLTLTGQGAKHAERPAVPQSRPLSRLRMRRGGREFFWIGKFHREIHFPPNASSCRGEHRPPMYKSRKDPSAAVKTDFPENFKFTLYNRANICYTMQSLNRIGDTCQWRSWIARWTPTPKTAGSPPAGQAIFITDTNSSLKVYKNIISKFLLEFL